MTTRPLVHFVAVAVTVLVLVLGAVNWYIRPEGAAAWLAAMLLLPVGWGLVVLAVRRAARVEGPATARRAEGAVRGAIILGGLMLLAGLVESLLTAWLGPTGPFVGLGQRSTMVLVGGYLMVTGNTMPKMLVPLSSIGCDGSRAQAFLRMSGWIWVLSGLTLLVSWAVLPIAIAKAVSLSVVAAGTVIVAALAFRLHATRGRPA